MSFSKVQVTVVAAVLMMLATTPIVSGFGWYCAPVHQRVIRADTVVVGRTISVDLEEVRPDQQAITFQFRVASVLKGSRYKPGDLIERKYEPHERIFGLTPFPWIEESPHLVFVNLGKEEREWFACTESAEDVDLKEIKRQIEVLKNPPDFFSSSNEQDVITVLGWIGRTYVSYEDGRKPRADWSSRAEPDRETIIQYLTRHARSKNVDVSIEAVSVLSRLYPPEAFDLFVSALDSTDDAKISLAAMGLKRLADERAIPLLIDRLKLLQTENEERQRRIDRGEDVQPRQRRERGWGRFASDWNPEHSLLMAIMGFDDPHVTGFLLETLKERGDRRVISSLARRKDPRTVELLLRLTWEGDTSAASALEKCDDERIVEQARERTFDHPLAPGVLAAQGDPEARAFMIRLIQQGHPAGARWAAVTRDQSAKAELIRSLDYYNGDHYHINMVAYALGRMRAFDLIPGLLEGDITWDTLIKASEMIMGLADRPRGIQDDCRGSEMWDCLRESLRKTASRERWSEREVELAYLLADAVEQGPRPQHFNDLYHPWSPPKTLSDMPDPLDKELTSAYLVRNSERCRQVLRDGSAEDQFKVIQAARHCKTNILDDDLAIRLLTSADGMVSGRVFFALSGGDLTLSIEGMERWALSGDFQSTRSALNYIFRHPKPEYAPIVTKVLYQGRHLFDKTLFQAIIETKATGCADLLRAYLENEHFALRFNGAVTLVHLGDEAGKVALAELEPNLRGCSQCLGHDYTQAALEQLR